MGENYQQTKISYLKVPAGECFNQEIILIEGDGKSYALANCSTNNSFFRVKDKDIGKVHSILTENGIDPIILGEDNRGSISKLIIYIQGTDSFIPNYPVREFLNCVGNLK